MPVLPEYLTIEEASRRYYVDKHVLLKLVENGLVRAVTVEGKTAVLETDVAVVAVQPDGEWVTISEAARRIGIPHSFVANWVRYGWIPFKHSGARAKLVPFNKVAALAELKQKYGRRGSRLIKRSQEYLLK